MTASPTRQDDRQPATTPTRSPPGRQAPLPGMAFDLDRKAGGPISRQLFEILRVAIQDGRLPPGSRLPSWRDLAVNLGVARGTVRAAYDRLADNGLVTASGAAGTWVSIKASSNERPPPTKASTPRGLGRRAGGPALPFQGGVPAQDGFPGKAWSRALSRAGRTDATNSVSYSDPGGRPELRAEIAGMLAVLRGLRCTPEQIFITTGFAGGLGLALQAIDLPAGTRVWTEEPGYPVARAGLALAGLRPAPCRVDDQGLDVEAAEKTFPSAAAALVTSSQQAPMGAALSASRRRKLLDWSARTGGWILEDDYLSDLQLMGRAARPLATDAEDPHRILHIGSFSKTLKPGLGMGFLVAPPELVSKLASICLALRPGPGDAVQLALAELIASGLYVRHLRRMKALYSARWEALLALSPAHFSGAPLAGPQTTLFLPAGTDDVALVSRARVLGIAPTALSPWYATEGARRSGLILSVTNLGPDQLPAAWRALASLLPGLSGAETSLESPAGVTIARSPLV